MFKVLGAVSLIAIFSGLFARESLGAELSSVLVIGGAILGTINVLVELVSWFKK